MIRNLIRKFARWLAPVTEEDVITWLDSQTEGELKDYGTLGKYKFFTVKKGHPGNL